jgi:hypothetical protein
MSVSRPLACHEVGAGELGGPVVRRVRGAGELLQLRQARQRLRPAPGAEQRQQFRHAVRDAGHRLIGLGERRAHRRGKRCLRGLPQGRPSELDESVGAAQRVGRRARPPGEAAGRGEGLIERELTLGEVVSDLGDPLDRSTKGERGATDAEVHIQREGASVRRRPERDGEQRDAQSDRALSGHLRQP